MTINELQAELSRRLPLLIHVDGSGGNFHIFAADNEKDRATDFYHRGDGMYAFTADECELALKDWMERP